MSSGSSCQFVLTYLNGLWHRRPPSPESPQPYKEIRTQSISLFPPSDAVPLQLGELIQFVKDFNKPDSPQLHIWSPSRKEPLACPIVLRFKIPDVVTVFLTIGQRPDHFGLVTENATAFGPREQVGRNTLLYIPRQH